MNIFLWILQVLLFLMFLPAGLTKTFRSKEKLSIKIPWVNDFDSISVKLIGICEALIAFGLILPQLTKIFPILTPIAAAALVVIQVLAAIYHARKKEDKAVVVNCLLIILGGIVAYGRL